jgi:predicted DNA-binding transcriptional regulator YafY
MTVPMLMGALARSDSTLRRDLKMMEEGLGAPIKWDAPSNTYWYTRTCDTLPLVRIEAEEAFALAQVAAMFTAVPELPLAQVFAGFLEKIKPMLGGAVSFPLDEVGRAVSVPFAFNAQETRRIGDLITAILQRRELHLRYCKRATTIPEDYTVHPVRLIPLDGRWTLVAYSPKAHELRHFVVVRIVDAQTNGATFKLPAGIDVDAHVSKLAGRFGGKEEHEVRVAVDKFAAFSIRETPWHPKQEFRPLPDGREELMLRTSSLPDIENKILRCGRHAEALEPQVLRDSVHAALKAALAQYE